MPIEYTLLRDAPVVLETCPCCAEHPFVPFMRGQVQRYRWFGWVKAYCAVICSRCKEIVGYETPDGKTYVQKTPGLLQGT